MSTRQKILVADSSKYFDKNFWNTMMAGTEFTVIGQASNPTEAVAMAANLTPDIILADLSHSEMAGLQTIHRLRQAQPQATIIALSLHTSRQYEQAALQAGANACVVKSELADQLVQRLYTLTTTKPPTNGHQPNSNYVTFAIPAISASR